MITLKSNDAHDEIHHRDLHQITKILHSTLFSVVFKACQRMFLIMHLMRTDDIVYVKILHLIEGEMIERKIKLKYL